MAYDYEGGQQIPIGAVHPLVGTHHQLEDIYNVAKDLDTFNTIALIDLELTEADHLALQQFEIANVTSDNDSTEQSMAAFLPGFNPSPFHFQEIPNVCLPYSISEFLKKISPNCAQGVLNQIEDLINKIVNRAASSFPKQAFAQYRISAFPVTEAVKGSGFHTDDDNVLRTDNLEDRMSLNFLTTLKGQHTLYKLGSPGEQNCTHLNNKARKSEMLSSDTYSASLGFGTVHRISDEYGAIHSPPFELKEPRLFLNIWYFGLK